MTDIDNETGLSAFFEQDHRDCDARWADVEELLDTAGYRSGTAGLAEIRNRVCGGTWRWKRKSCSRPLNRLPAWVAAGRPRSCAWSIKQMRGLLDQIGAAMESGDAEQAMDIGDTLLMLVQQHNIKEEGMLYPMAENVLAGSWPKLVELLEEY